MLSQVLLCSHQNTKLPVSMEPAHVCGIRLLMTGAMYALCQVWKGKCRRGARVRSA